MCVCVCMCVCMCMCVCVCVCVSYRLRRVLLRPQGLSELGVPMQKLPQDLSLKNWPARLLQIITIPAFFFPGLPMQRNRRFVFLTICLCVCVSVCACVCVCACV